MRVRSRLIGVVAGGAFGALALSVPAAAEMYQRTDPAGDMWSEVDADVEPVPDADNADVRDVSVDHRLHAVVIKLTYTDLRWEHGYLAPLTGHIRTDERKVRDIEIVRFDGPDTGWRFKVHNAYRSMRCGQTGTVDLEANTATLRLPRSACLSDPRWVRVALAGESSRPNPDGPGFESPADNALTTGRWYVAKPGHTPRLYRD